MTDFALTSVLDDPDYWQRREHRSIRYAIVLGMAIVGLTFVAFMWIVYSWHVDTSRHRLQQERACLTQGGQWIKEDCVNNFINIGPPAGESPAPGTGTNG